MKCQIYENTKLTSVGARFNQRCFHNRLPCHRAPLHEINNSLKWMRDSWIVACSLHVYMQNIAEVCVKMGRYLIRHFK